MPIDPFPKARALIADAIEEAVFDAFGMEPPASNGRPILSASQGPRATPWCNACHLNPANGCRHPLGPECCPCRARAAQAKEGEDGEC